MNDLTTIEDEVLRFALDCPVDTIAELLNKLAFMKQRISATEKVFKGRLLERIAEHGEFTIGTVRYYAGNKKETESRNDEATAVACLELAGGDIAAMFRDFISKGPFKHGNIRKQLNDDAKFNELFEVTTKPVLEQGKPTKQLLSADERFIR